MGFSMSRWRCRIAGQGLGHGGVGEPLVADVHEIALLSGKALALEQRPGRIAGVDSQTLRPARLRQLRQRLDQRAARALASEFGIDEQHVDVVSAFEAGEAGDGAVDHCEQGPGGREPGAESLFVVGARSPGLALLFVVVIRGQLPDARAKDLGAASRVGRQIGAKRDGAHHFGSQLVVPSLLSLMATPSAARRSRNRSDSAQSRAARASARSATIALTSAASIFASLSAIAWCSDRVCCRRPRRLALVLRRSGADACPPRRWSLATASGVLRSSVKAFRTSESGSPFVLTSPTASYQRSSVASASSSAFTVQSIG